MEFNQCHCQIPPNETLNRHNGPVRVIHLVTSPSGGAGVAAMRTSAALQQAGVESQIMTRFQRFDRRGKKAELFLRIASGVVTRAQQGMVQSGRELVTPLSINTLGDQEKVFSKMDVIHIHAYYNFLNEQSLRGLADLEKPIFVTLHDQRFFTGGCHYSIECSNYMQNCAKCPQVRTPFRGLVEHHFQLQRDAIDRHRRLHVISPSEWLGAMAKESSILSRSPISVVHNPIPATFREIDRESIREELGLNSKRVAIAFSSIDLFNPYKGLRILTDAIQGIPDAELDRFHFFFLGGGKKLDLRDGVRSTVMSISGDPDMARILSAMDFLVCPSTQDNSPSVIGESLMCGTQVIGAQVGGIPELLKPLGAELFPSGDSRALTQIIMKLNREYDRFLISNQAQRIFGESEIAGQLNRLYRESLASSR